jgi:hypothetical protein
MQLFILMRIWIRIQTQLFTLMWIRILLLIKVMGEICDHWSIYPLRLHFEPPVLHGSILSLKLLNCAFDADTDPASKNDAGPDPEPQLCIWITWL